MIKRESELLFPMMQQMAAFYRNARFFLIFSQYHRKDIPGFCPVGHTDAFAEREQFSSFLVMRVRYNDLSLGRGRCMLLPHHVFTVLLTENPKVLIEISVSTLVFTKVLTVFLLNFR